MAVKKLIQGEPRLNDLSQYNFDDNETNFDYKNSIGLLKNNDKFQNKDLYTKAVGSELNNAIIERNLKVEGESFIKFNELYIENAGVSGKQTNNNVRCYMLSQNLANLDNKSYSYISNALTVESRFLNLYPGDRNRDSDIGNIGSLENQIIVQNLKSDSIEIEEFSNNEDSFEVNEALLLRETDEEAIADYSTSIIDENIYNPIYIIVWMKGDKDNNVGGDAQRKRRYTVFKINNLDLFTRGDDGISSGGKLTTFTKDDLSHYSVTGDGDGGTTDAAAWRVRDFSITISTRIGGANNWDGTVDELSTDEKEYVTYFPEVQPPINVSPVDLNKFGLLNLTPSMQLNNGNNAGRDYTDLFPDYFPQTTIKVLNENNEMQDEDLQSYYDDNETLSIKASAPATIAIDLNPIDLENEQSIGIDYFYFVIDWDDATDEIKTLDDWNEIRPTDEFELLELQNQNLYKLKTNVEPVDDYTILTIAKDYNIYHIINFGDENIDGFPPIRHAGDGFDDVRVYLRLLDGSSQSDNPPVIGEQITIQGTDSFDGTYEIQGNDFGDYAYLVFPSVGDEPYEEGSGRGFVDGDDPIGTARQEIFTTFNSNVSFDNTIPMNTYTTPGIKTIKAVMFSYDKETNQVGRWKLITSRFYLDIPINQYPDFAEVGGSDYTTIPWPYTTPVIGGVDSDSKYKKSVEQALSSGNIGDADIIDERFLINDLENDELGKSINEMDLEQCRYFNKPYGINELLNIVPDPTVNPIYLEENYLSSLPFPQYFQEFNITATGTLSEEDANLWTNNYARPDIGNEILNILSQIEEWNTLPEQEFVGAVRLQDSNQNPGRFFAAQYWSGTPGDCPFVTNNGDGTYSGWAALYHTQQPPFDNVSDAYDNYHIFDHVTDDLEFPPPPPFFDAVDAADIYYSEHCSDRSCIVERHPDCDGSWAGGTYKAYNVIAPKPPIEDILPPSILDLSEDDASPLDIDVSQYFNDLYFVPVTVEPYNSEYWDGDVNKFPMESSVGQIFISDNQDVDLKQSCKLELNTGELTGKSIYDSSGNSNKGLLIGDYKVKKVRKGEPMRRDSFIKIPKKANNNNGAL